MGIDWQGISEIGFGLIVEGKLSPQSFTPDEFFPPYDKGIELIQSQPDSTRESLAQAVGLQAFQSAHQAIISLNGLGATTDWGSLIKKQAAGYRAAIMMEKGASRLKRGEELDSTPIIRELSTLSSGKPTRLMLASEVEWRNWQALKPCGWSIIDRYFGGVPTVGLVVVFGSTGTGKSFWLSKFMSEYLHHYTDQVGALYTLEMVKEQNISRSIKMYPRFEEILPRLYVNSTETAMSGVKAVQTESMTIPNLGFIGIDYADFLVSDEGEQAYKTLCMRLVEIVRTRQILVVLLAQPSREGYKTNRFPHKTDIRWSGMFENSADQLIALFRCDDSLDMEDDALPALDEHYYMINWKQREAPNGKPIREGSAIILKPHPTGILWEGDVHGNHLWIPGSGRKLIGSKKH